MCRDRLGPQVGTSGGHTGCPRPTQDRVANSPEARIRRISEAIRGLTRAARGGRQLRIKIVRQAPSSIRTAGPHTV